MKWLKPLTDLFKKPEPPKEPEKPVVVKRPVGRPKRSTLTPPSTAPSPTISMTNGGYRKFTRKYQLKIIRYIGQGMSNGEILAMVKVDTGIETQARAIEQYRITKKWQPLIEKERQAYLNNVQDVPGYHDKVRLERADKIFNYAIQNDDPELALKATEQQRKEVKESTKQPVSFVFQQYNTLSQDELEDKYSKALEIIEKNRKKNNLVIEGGK